jgi:hypothetical protein
MNVPLETEMNSFLQKMFWKNVIFVTAMFLIVFAAVPLFQLDGLNKMPGDIGDARLNNYFLENIYQYVNGQSDSLWNLGFFSPFPYVLGYSDNLFGASPIYVAARILGAPSDTAFQLWFLFGYFANFAASYFVLRKYEFGIAASLVGALIFTFALPTTSQVGHSQLHFRYGIPLAIYFFINFLENKNWRDLIVSGAWLVWQFYAGIYMGFFAILFLVIIFVTYITRVFVFQRIKVKDFARDFTTSWTIQSGQRKLWLVVSAIVLAALILLLFYPYVYISRTLNVSRGWDEISTMLPRLQSYILSDASFFWSNSDSRLFAGMPVRHEHQMFVGAVPLILAFVGFFITTSKTRGTDANLILISFAIIVLLTLNVGGFSLWYIFHKLPLASAIRVLTRIDQVLLFPIGFFAAIAVDAVRVRFARSFLFVVPAVLLALILEFSSTSMSTSPKSEWRDRIEVVNALLPSNLPDGSILFFAQRGGPYYADELDAMWISIIRGHKTLNGYSGLYPPQYLSEFGNDCAEMASRVSSYAQFSGQSLNEKYFRTAAAKIVPVGFVNCGDGNDIIISALPGKLKVGERLEFNTDGKGESSLQSGWSVSESWGTWSKDTVASIFLNIGSDRVSSINFEARAFSHPSQRMEVRVNGALAGKTEIRESDLTFTIKIPEAVLQNTETNGLTIEFQFPDATRPIDVGLGNDARRLALGLISLTLQ